MRAFLLREMKAQYGRARLGYFWALAEPAATVAILTALHTSVTGGGGVIYQESPVVFFVFGAVPYFLFSNSLAQTQGVCMNQKGLFNYRQIKPIDIMLARSVIDALMMTGVMLVFLLAWSWLGLKMPQIRLLELAMALFSLFALGLSLGLVFEVFGTVFQDLRKIFSIVTRPLFFVSGAFFTMDMLPSGLGTVLYLNPVLHGVDLTRDAVLASYDSPASWVYLWSCILVLQFIGLAAYRRYLYQLI
ncbi:ABC transporter permease [Fontimonas sp. SYSU GA230001]|uniref:ABC transporter permease n=1 Tax=Fontimonas sp. SYSU GA230001 TaxID=3142450 RepID=UPI0032B3653F